jgi:hypothetical protein
MNKAVLGVLIAAFLLSITTQVSAIGLGCTADGNLLHNITNLADGTEWVWEENCEGAGCRQIEGGFVCATAAFVIPMELYILFEIIAFAFMFITIITFRENKKGEDNIIFPLLAMVMFGALGIMSFNLVGLEFMMGAALNGSMALLSLVYVVIVGVGIWTGR